MSPSESHFQGDKSDQLQKRGLEEESMAEVEEGGSGREGGGRKIYINVEM